MEKRKKIGIIICDRYRNCAGGKCFRALGKREGAFSIYQDIGVELVGYTSCGGCPGGNVEYAPEEMQKNGAEIIHLASGLVVRYPPCPYLENFRDYIKTKFAMDVVIGTHPIPQKYFETHSELGSWESPYWQELISPILTNEVIRRSYD
jgi:predicted metal-binding protein